MDVESFNIIFFYILFYTRKNYTRDDLNTKYSLVSRIIRTFYHILYLPPTSSNLNIIRIYYNILRFYVFVFLGLFALASLTALKFAAASSSKFAKLKFDS